MLAQDKFVLDSSSDSGVDASFSLDLQKKSIVVEASCLRLPPGIWPIVVKVSGMTFRFADQKSVEGELLSVIYEAAGDWTLHILND